MDAATLQSNLGQFCGTEELHRWSILYPKFVLTDGAQYLAENAGAYWLMDVIGSYQRKLLKAGEVFQVWELKTENDKGMVTCTDGNDNVLVKQNIPFTDFPLSEIRLYADFEDGLLVIMLPGEY